MEMGGRLQDFFSRVVAMSSTAETRECSVAPVKRLIFHTSACFLLSYLALPAAEPTSGVRSTECSAEATGISPVGCAVHQAMTWIRADILLVALQDAMSWGVHLHRYLF